MQMIEVLFFVMGGFVLIRLYSYYRAYKIANLIDKERELVVRLEEAEKATKNLKESYERAKKDYNSIADKYRKPSDDGV